MISLSESLAQHLPREDLAALRAASENGDKQTFDAFARQYFSSWKTSLMGSDLQTLRDLLLHEDLRKYVTTIHIEDDWEVNDPGPMIAGPGAGPPVGAVHIWPRDKDRTVKSGEIGVGDLRDMLKGHKFRPEVITIRDFRGGNVACDPQPCAALARDLLDGIDMAVKSFAFRRDVNSYGALEMTFTFYPEDQDRNVGLAKLQSAQFILTRNVESYWQEQISRAVDPLNLTIAHAEPFPDLSAPTTFSMPAPKLASLEIVRAEVSSRAVLDMVANSQTTLKNISFHMVKLTNSASWSPLLLQISRECSNLSTFKLGLLSTASRATPTVKFQISKESVAEGDRDGLEFTEKGSNKLRRVNAVRYSGPNVAGVLQVVAKSAVNWGYVPGTHDIVHA